MHPGGAVAVVHYKATRFLAMKTFFGQASKKLLPPLLFKPVLHFSYFLGYAFLGWGGVVKQALA